ncbi:MAG: hypothetical protein HY781_13385 [Chloroflexi bacterium]|nr:hypothetical protein [Chloroflexota bacterium]
MPKKKARKSERKVHKETPLVVWLWTLGLGFLGYVIAEIALDVYPHPVHWASGAGGAVFGFLVGWLWYKWKGDVI